MSEFSSKSETSPQPKKSPWLKIFLGIVFVVMVLFGISFVALALIVANVNPNIDENGLIEKTVEGGGRDASKSKIAIIPITGAIMGSGSHLSGKGMMLQVVKQIRTAADDDDVKAIILQINSPGGGLTASDIIYNEILRAKKMHKKILVSVGDMAASGGYYISAPADYIVCNPTGLVGSFGVIMERVQVKKLLEKIGVKVEPIKSTASKDIGSPFREMTKDEHAYFQDMIGQFHQRFVEIVAKGRNLEVAAVKKLATGKVYTAKEALGYKLIDKIGYFDDALAKAKTMIKVPNPKVITYETPKNLLQQILLGASSTTPARRVSFNREAIFSLLHELQTARIQARAQRF